MKKLRQISLFILVTILTPIIAKSQVSQADLLKDLVKFSNSKMMITDLELLTQSDGTSNLMQKLQHQEL